MKKTFHSFRELKSAFLDSALDDGLTLSSEGKHSEAVRCFDRLKDFSTADSNTKSQIRSSYSTHGKLMQHEGRFEEALRCFSRARAAYPNDVLLHERTKLLASREEYRTSWNIGEFRKYFGLGVTSGGFEKYKWPFLEIARQKEILQEPLVPPQSASINAIKSIGVYKIQAQGRHILSYKIREYKRGNASLALPFAWLLADYMRNLTEFVKFVDMIVPSPSNPNKYVVRGFIPSLLIGKELSKCLAIPYRELFSVAPMDCRFRDLPYSQAKALIKSKHKQIDKLVSGNKILLLDDVITTGRTLTLLADLLGSAGATAVYGLVVAKTGAESHSYQG